VNSMQVALVPRKIAIALDILIFSLVIEKLLKPYSDAHDFAPTLFSHNTAQFVASTRSGLQFCILVGVAVFSQ
jgi:hypothetical protein